MKLIVAGPTGFVGSEVLRQALLNPAVTSVIALARGEPQSGIPTDPKLEWIVLEDWLGAYPPSVKDTLKGASACIWAVGASPYKIEHLDNDVLDKLYPRTTHNALEQMASTCAKPFRFICASGNHYWQTKGQDLRSQNAWLGIRMQLDLSIGRFAAATPGFEAAIAKPNGLHGPDNPAPEGKWDPIDRAFLPSLHVSEFAVAMVHQAVNGIKTYLLGTRSLLGVGKAGLTPEMYLGWIAEED